MWHATHSTNGGDDAAAKAGPSEEWARRLQKMDLSVRAWEQRPGAGELLAVTRCSRDSRSEAHAHDQQSGGDGLGKKEVGH
jgi:hypothetical protein